MHSSVGGVGVQPGSHMAHTSTECAESQTLIVSLILNFCAGRPASLYQVPWSFQAAPLLQDFAAAMLNSGRGS